MLDLSLTQIAPEISSKALWIFFGVFLALVILGSLVLMYHWNKYKEHGPFIRKATVIFVIGIIVLATLAIITLASYTFS